MSGVVNIKSGSEADLHAAVATVGPISITVDGSSNGFRVYKSYQAYKKYTLALYLSPLELVQLQYNTYNLN